MRVLPVVHSVFTTEHSSTNNNTNNTKYNAAALSSHRLLDEQPKLEGKGEDRLDRADEEGKSARGRESWTVGIPRAEGTGGVRDSAHEGDA